MISSASHANSSCICTELSIREYCIEKRGGSDGSRGGVCVEGVGGVGGGRAETCRMWLAWPIPEKVLSCLDRILSLAAFASCSSRLTSRAYAFCFCSAACAWCRRMVLLLLIIHHYHGNIIIMCYHEFILLIFFGVLLFALCFCSATCTMREADGVISVYHNGIVLHMIIHLQL